MTIYAQDFIKGRLASTDLPTCNIVAHPTQANRWRLVPVTPLDSAQLSVVSYLFDDVSPHDDGAEISVPAEYPPAPAAAAPGRDWLTPENTLERRLETVLMEHGLLANVKSITPIAGQYVVKFAGSAPGVPVGSKRADLAQAGLRDIKAGSPGTWVVGISDQWRIELQAGDLLRQRDAEIRELRDRINSLKGALDHAIDSNTLLQADRDCARVDRDRAMSDVRALESQLLDAAARIDPHPMPKWAPRRDEIGYTMPAGCRLEIAVSLEQLNELLKLGGRMIGQPEFRAETDLRVLVEMREGKAARLPGVAGRVTVIDRSRPYTMRRADRIARDNAEVFHAIRATPRTPVQPMTPLGGAS